MFDPNSVASPPGGPAWQVALLFPDQGDWSEEEYLSLKTRRLVEYDNGCIEVLPMPTLMHQLMVDFLHSQLKAFVLKHALGLAFFAPVPVRLRKAKYREPDVFFLRNDRVRDLQFPTGADLVMEIVSEGTDNRRRDLETKPQEYAQSGISEYWIVDPEQRRITVLALEGQTYRVHGEFGTGQTALSALLPGFSVAVDAVWAAAEGMDQTPSN